MQVRKHSALLHTFDLSIQVERDSAQIRVAPVKPLSIPRLDMIASYSLCKRRRIKEIEEALYFIEIDRGNTIASLFMYMLAEI